MRLKRWQTKVSSLRSNENVQSYNVIHDGVSFISSRVILFGMWHWHFSNCVSMPTYDRQGLH
jgi:hypothetical protein